MSRPMKVVVINSLSYTGTTWLNMVLGSHERTFALGPPDRAYESRTNGWDDRCRVHGTECPFWPRFFERSNPQQNFFLQLAEFSGKDVIVTNNPVPDGAGRELNHPQIELKNIQVVRDGRAIAASYYRKFPQTSFMDVVGDWLHPSFSTFRFDPDDPDLMSVRYEDILADQRNLLARFGQYVGLDYDDSALAFWNWDHHPAAGNQGTIMMIKFAQGIAVPAVKDKDFYQEQFAKVRSKTDESFNDKRWREELSRRDLFVFDYICGAVNERFGYDRDRFTVSEMETFSRELSLAVPTGRRQVSAVRASRSVSMGSIGSASSLGLRTAGLRRQFTPAWLRTHGLSLTPSQIKKLSVLFVLLLLVFAGFVALATALVFR